METKTTTPPATTETEFDLASYLTLTNLFIFTILLLILFVIFKSPSGGEGGEEGGEQGSNKVFMVVLAVAVLFAFYKLVQNYNVSTELIGEGTKTPQLDITIDHLTGGGAPGPRLDLTSKQVFNIPGNYYTYDQAKVLCEAYDADLATYDQVERAYNSGGEWCNYGWSEGQMALFPTQKASYDRLQKIEGHEHDCGRPGVNGGYIANPNVKFGVNCYGKKPPISQYEADLMRSQPPYPINEKDILFQKQVDYWKNKINDILISPFNYNSWSKI